MITYGDVTEISYSPRLKLLVFIALIGFCIITLWNIDIDFSDFWTSSYIKISIEPKSWLMPVSLFLVSYAFIVAVPALLDSHVQVRISRKGFYWRRWSETTIPWSEVVEINAGTSSKSPFSSDLSEQLNFRSDLTRVMRYSFRRHFLKVPTRKFWLLFNPLMKSTAANTFLKLNQILPHRTAIPVIVTCSK